ncbi:EAL domain-containing protein [Rhodococcus antarcticus]|uniref:EAL domain-containing protein n=1 Tax=Rhodococcus antarcticus TaxID=2987751 RepID=A0ABY6NY10_9NOCA|nr:EAL domain-containing protein [Rhodococcus antarcticus]UZJ24285.1 EAL domain-containing protein [Rhodococcus antarcticus]
MGGGGPCACPGARDIGERKRDVAGPAAPGALLGFEALVRWQHPERGLLGPGEFIPDAEETGLIVALGEHVLRTALQEAAGWVTAAGPRTPPGLSVNVSARQLDEQDLPQVVAAALHTSGSPAASLALEINQTVVMHDVQRSVAGMRALRATGVQISIDDFGTGYSSLNYLKRLPVTTLEIDRELVSGLGHDPHDSAIVTAVIALARQGSAEPVRAPAGRCPPREGTGSRIAPVAGRAPGAVAVTDLPGPSSVTSVGAEGRWSSARCARVRHRVAVCRGCAHGSAG